MGRLLKLKYKKKMYWYFQERDPKGRAHEYVFTDKEYKDAQKRSEKIHAAPMKEYEIFEVW